LIGVWSYGGKYLQFREDGTFRGGSHPDLEEYPSEIGPFHLDGTSLTLITSEDSLLCSGQTGRFEVELIDRDQLKLTLREDECQPRGSGMTADPWTRILSTEALVSPTPEATEPTVTSPVTVTKDIVYAVGTQQEEGTEWKLDEYAPTEPGDWPVVVFLHGIDEAKEGWTVLPQAIAEQGAIVLVIDYPEIAPTVAILEKGKGHREMAETVACAIRFARARASDLGSDTAPVVIAGFSFGGGVGSHVALLGESIDRRWEDYATSRGGPPHQVDCEVSQGSTHVDALVGIAGAYDAFVGYDGRYGREFMQEKDPDLWEMLYGSIGENLDLKVRLLHSETDSQIPYENSVEFEATLAEAGYDVILIPFRGGHTTPLDLTVQTVMEVVGD
jgi:acetyl esterase/lipase